MGDRRPTNSELRLRRLELEEEAVEERGILELFDEPWRRPRVPDVDSPLARDGDAEPGSPGQ
jgi:hypothetical protein